MQNNVLELILPRLTTIIIFTLFLNKMTNFYDPFSTLHI